MPVFNDEAKDGVEIQIDTEGKNGDFVIKIGRKTVELNRKDAKRLSEQIGFAVEYVDLYARGPR